jgi:hypothetical protein
MNYCYQNRFRTCYHNTPGPVPGQLQTCASPQQTICVRGEGKPHAFQWQRGCLTQYRLFHAPNKDGEDFSFSSGPSNQVCIVIPLEAAPIGMSASPDFLAVRCSEDPDLDVFGIKLFKGVVSDGQAVLCEVWHGEILRYQYLR